MGAFMRHLPVEIRRVRMWRDELYRTLGGGTWEEDDAVDCRWPATPRGHILGRKSGMKMCLDLSDWAERRTYFTGRFYQEEIEEILTSLLRPGDNFVDAGANIGLVSLHAASIIGSTGGIWAFEPHPDTFRRLLNHFEMNELNSENLRNFGLGAKRTSLDMKTYGRHSGKATLVERHAARSANTITVDVHRGDESLASLDPKTPTVIKIDVEGFEVPVIEGLGDILDGNVAVLVEVSRAWLDAAGSSARQLHNLLQRRGLVPHTFEFGNERWRRRLIVRRVGGPLNLDQYDCLFIRPDSGFASRLSALTNITSSLP